MKIDIKAHIIHKESCKDFLMHYLIENPKTTSDDKELNKQFSAQFPLEDLEHQLNLLYSHGIASRYAMLQFYICDDVIELIISTLKTGRTPEWA